jgi:hypothetical protein
MKVKRGLDWFGSPKEDNPKGGTFNLLFNLSNLFNFQLWLWLWVNFGGQQ